MLRLGLLVVGLGAGGGLAYRAIQARAPAASARAVATAPARAPRPLPPPRLDWAALVSERVESEVATLRGPAQVAAFLDRLLAEAEQQGKLTPLQTAVGRQAIDDADDLDDAERSRLAADFLRRLLALQERLPPQPRLVHPGAPARGRPPP